MLSAQTNTKKDLINFSIDNKNFQFDLGTKNDKLANSRKIRILVKSISQDKVDNRDITNEAVFNKHVSRKAEIEVIKYELILKKSVIDKLSDLDSWH